MPGIRVNNDLSGTHTIALWQKNAMTLQARREASSTPQSEESGILTNAAALQKARESAALTGLGNNLDTQTGLGIALRSETPQAATTDQTEPRRFNRDDIQNTLATLSATLRNNDGNLQDAAAAPAPTSKEEMSALSDMLSQAQTVEGTFAEISTKLTLMWELADESTSSTLNDAQRLLTNNEFQKLSREVMQDYTTLKESGTLEKMQSGDMGAAMNTQRDAAVSGNQNAMQSITEQLGTLDISSYESVKASLSTMDTVISDLTKARGTNGVYQNSLLQIFNAGEEPMVSQQTPHIPENTSATTAREDEYLRVAQNMMAQSNLIPNSVLKMLQ